MWHPATAAELGDLVTRGALDETCRIDFKRDVTGKSKDIAKDVAAMANDGGILCYGVGEAEHRRPAILAPFKLAGEPERLASTVRDGLAEPPEVDIRALRTHQDPSIGNLWVIVPASPRAPHMVVLGKEH